ncbi:Ger(x)C family spore germination protein [Fictibacillus nanhaiensis]|uniref:Ger(x)C family spore germination protein n=1 Tax=Fictibacillus nanhaiensis TaxID=742169 RepID=UPI00203FEDA6|nr:Ger(x)C family spore germination protein [Fictibacillus nanhaiensis]MCM3734103.1 Ger(x)C family spore germination protein [Fictibacillus nanhaiensis]
MKKAGIGILLLLLLTGCWDRLPLRDLKLVDIAGFDLDKESEDVELHFVVTKLKSAGQGEGEPNSEITKLKGPSLVQAIGQGEYIDQAPFLGVNTRIYLLSKRFASHDPVGKLAFLLHAPYASINTPVVILDGSMSKFLKTDSSPKKEFTKNLNEFILSIEKNGIMTNVSMMDFILSQKEPIEDIALPLLKPFDSGMELTGALLFRQGKNTGAEIDIEQVRMLMMMLGKYNGRQKYTGNLSNDTDYGFSVKRGNSRITISQVPSQLPKVNIGVRLKINVFQLGEDSYTLKPDYVNRMEKELSKHLEEKAVETIKTLQKANCDVLGIGKQLKAYHPNIWKSLNWRKDYPRLSIEPNFEVQILNSDAE